MKKVWLISAKVACIQQKNVPHWSPLSNHPCAGGKTLSFPLIFRETPCCQAAATEAETSFLIAAARITLQPLTTPVIYMKANNTTLHHTMAPVMLITLDPLLCFVAVLDLVRMRPKVKNWIFFYESSDIGVLKCQGLILQQNVRRPVLRPPADHHPLNIGLWTSLAQNIHLIL